MMKLWIFLGGHYKTELFWGSFIYISGLFLGQCTELDYFWGLPPPPGCMHTHRDQHYH